MGKLENGPDVDQEVDIEHPSTIHVEEIEHHSKLPDGGYGWIVTFASFMCHFIADGLAFTFGIIYPELLNAFGTSKSTTSWIGSLFFGVPLICGPLAGLFVNKYGCRASTITGGVITSLGILMSSFANSVEMLAFTYGIVAAFGLAFIYVPASVIPSFWFEKRRALATGLAAAGSGLGTFSMAPLTEALLRQYGWRGTLLVMSGITLNFIVFGALFREVKTSAAAETMLGPQDKHLLADSLSSVVSLSSVASNHSLADEETAAPEELNTRAADVTNSPMRKHHSTNTVFSGEEFESLKISYSRIAGKRQRASMMNSSPRQLSLLHSNQNFLPVSRHDITSVMNLAMRQRTISSCPELSIMSDEDDDEPDKHCHKVKRTRPAASLCSRISMLAKEMCDVRLLAVPVYLLFFISSFTLSYAYDLPYIYLPDYATSLNISKSSFLISIIGIVNTFGQVLFGYLGDRKCIDTVLLYGLSLLLCGALVTAIPLLTSYPALATFSVVFGFLISANFSLETVVLVKILSLEQLTKAYGLLMFGQGVASLIGPPIGGLLWDVTGQYVYTFIFAGVSIIMSAVMSMGIICVRKSGRSRSTSESTDMVSHLNI